MQYTHTLHTRYTRVYTCMCTYMYTHTFIWNTMPYTTIQYTHVCVYMWTYAYKHIYAHAHTYAHTHTHSVQRHVTCPSPAPEGPNPACTTGPHLPPHIAGGHAPSSATRGPARVCPGPAPEPSLPTAGTCVSRSRRFGGARIPPGQG